MSITSCLNLNLSLNRHSQLSLNRHSQLKRQSKRNLKSSHPTTRSSIVPNHLLQPPRLMQRKKKATTRSQTIASLSSSVSLPKKSPSVNSRRTLWRFRCSRISR